MKARQVKLNGQQQALEIQREHLLVADIVRYLSGLAKLHGEDKTGNSELSFGLLQVTKALRPYADCPVVELAAAIKNNSVSAVRAKSDRKPEEPAFPPELDSRLESIGQDEIERILNDDAGTKRQIVELGFRRFGISRSKLERLSLKDARYSVRAALENEKTLEVISQEARKAGKARAS